MFKVLLIHANSCLDTLIPPNLATISAVLKQRGHQVRLFDTTFYKTRPFTGDDARVRTLQVRETRFEDLGIHLNKTDMYEDFLKVVKEYKPDLVGLSAVELTYPFGIEFLRRLKGIPTIVGGTYATICPDEVLKEESVDFVCVGEGAYALADLCDALKKNRPRKIENIYTKTHRASLRPPVDLDKLPFQDWTIFDQRRVYKPMAGRIRRVGSIELNRGCPFSCSYCCNEFIKELGYPYREKGIARFIKEAEYMKEKYKLEYIYVLAETFLTREKRLYDFCQGWKKIGLPFWCQSRPETISESKIRRLEKTGCSSISVGLESGDPEIRKLLGRPMSDETIIKAFRILKNTGMKICANSVIGIPTETRKQVFKTIELNRQVNADNIMIHVFNAYRGTRLYELCCRKNYILPEALGKDYRADAMLDMPQLSSEEVRGLQRTFAMYVKFPKKMWPELQEAEQVNEQGNKIFTRLSRLYKKRFLN